MIMTSFQKFPFLLSAFMAVLVGLISFSAGTDGNNVYLYMIIAMVTFYIIGLYAVKTLENVKNEVDKKNAEIENEKALAEENERIAQKIAAKASEASKGKSINLTAEDPDDMFEPLTVSRVIASKLKEKE